jgi:tetratricopeptide (TPR) repeat protein
LEILELALDESPSSAAQQELMRVLQELWSLRFEKNQMDDAEDALLQAIDLGMRLDEDFGEDPNHTLSLMGLRTNHSIHLSKLNREEEACAQLDLAIEEGDPLALSHPGIAEIRQSLFSARSNRGASRMKLGNNSGAEEDFQRAAELLAGLIEEQPSSERTGKLAVLQCNLGGLQVALERHAEATVTFRESIANAEKAMISLPSAPNLRSVHQFSRVNLALCKIVLGGYQQGMEVVMTIEYRQDGYLTPANIMSLLSLYKAGVDLALEDEFLDEEDRDALAEEYAVSAARYLKSARANSGQVLDEMLAKFEWGIIKDFPEFGEALTAPR